MVADSKKYKLCKHQKDLDTSETKKGFHCCTKKQKKAEHEIKMEQKRTKKMSMTNLPIKITLHTVVAKWFNSVNITY